MWKFSTITSSISNVNNKSNHETVTNLDDDFIISDLRQENNILRQEINDLCIKLSNQNHKPYDNDAECQTDEQLVFDIVIIKNKFNDQNKELSYQKALSIEHAKSNKELEYKVHQLESKLLESNVELLKKGPMKTKIDELTKIIEQSQSKNNKLINDLLNINIEMNHHINNIDKYKKQIEELDLIILNNNNKLSLLQEANIGIL